MKKETLITAIVFLSVGFLAGFAYNAHRNSVQRQKAVAAGMITPAAGKAAADAADSSGSSNGQALAAPAPSGLASQLPKGHPALTEAEVIQFFKEAVSHNPADPSPRLKLANFLYDRQHYSEAIAWYQQVLTLDPKNANARTDLATCYFNLGHPDKAIRQLQAALKADPRHAPTLFNLVVVNMQGTHDYAAARKALVRLQAINPSYPGLEQLAQALNAASK